MKVLYDHQIFWYQPYGGISNYFAGLMDYAYATHNFSFELSAKYANNRYIQGKPFAQVKPFLPKYAFPGKNSLFFALKKQNESQALKSLKSGAIDLFHPSYFDTYYLGKTKVPFVVNFFDMIMEKFPNLFSPRVQYSEEKKKLISKAAQIIVCSKNSKKDFVEYYNYDKDQVTISPLASTLPKTFDVHKLTIDTRTVPKKYIIFIGGRDLYKNFTFFIKSIGPLLAKDPELFVVCAGKGLSSTEQALLSALGVLDRVKCYSVKDTDLQYLYRNAQLFVYPSLYEGFGIPILEAFENKCPVAVSNTSCFPEVAQSAAAYFDPSDADSLQSTVADLLINTKKVQKLVKKGTERAKDFSPELTARTTIGAYKKALS